MFCSISHKSVSTFFITAKCVDNYMHPLCHSARTIDWNREKLFCNKSKKKWLNENYPIDNDARRDSLRVNLCRKNSSSHYNQRYRIMHQRYELSVVAELWCKTKKSRHRLIFFCNKRGLQKIWSKNHDLICFTLVFWKSFESHCETTHRELTTRPDST